MRKKDFLKPDIDDLYPGNILPIYEEYTIERGFLGNARLIEYSPSWRPELHYIRAEIGGTELQEPNAVNWSYQRWIVEFVDGPKEGFRTAKYIAYFLCINSDLPNEI